MEIKSDIFILNVHKANSDKKAEDNRKWRSNLTDEQRKKKLHISNENILEHKNKLERLRSWSTSKPKSPVTFPRCIERISVLASRKDISLRLKKNPGLYLNLNQLQRLGLSKEDKKMVADYFKERRRKSLEEKNSTVVLEENIPPDTTLENVAIEVESEKPECPKLREERERGLEYFQRLCNEENAKKERHMSKIEQKRKAIEERKAQKIAMREEAKKMKAEREENSLKRKNIDQQNKNYEIKKQNLVRISELHSYWFNKFVEERGQINPWSICKWGPNVINEESKSYPNCYQCHNPLKRLIRLVIENGMYVKKIPEIDADVFREILLMFELNNSQDNNNIKQKLCYEIITKYLIVLLRKWIGWIKYHNVYDLTSVNAYIDMYCYLYYGFLDIQAHVENSLFEVLKNKYVENYLAVTCSLKQLKMLFYHNPRNYIKYYRDDTNDAYSTRELGLSFPNCILNWPFISIHISLPNISLSRYNVNVDEFHLVNMKNQFESPVMRQKTARQIIESSGNENDMNFSKIGINEFFNELKILILNENEENMAFETQTELVKVITEFQKDIVYCPRVIRTNSKYHNFSQHRYIRYFGYPDDGNMRMTVTEQLSVQDPSLNVSLRQTTTPKVTFVMERFDPDSHWTSIGTDFTFDDSFVVELKNCLRYKCTLCGEDMGSCAVSPEIFEHLIKCHGLEMEWVCADCGGAFFTNYLSVNRWAHDCESLTDEFIS